MFPSSLVNDYPDSAARQGRMQHDISTPRPIVMYVFTVSISVTFMLEFVPRLIAAGIDVHILCSSGSELKAAESMGATIWPVEIARAPSPLQDFRALWQVYQVMQRVRPAISNVGTPKAGLIGGLAAWLARVPHRVYTMHGLRLETMQGLARRIFWITEWLACRCATSVLCVSHGLRQQVLAMGLCGAAKAKVLGKGSCCGIDTRAYTPPLRHTNAGAAAAQGTGHYERRSRGRFRRTPRPRQGHRGTL